MTDLRSALGSQRLAAEQRRHRHRWDVGPSQAMLEDNDLRMRCRCGARQDMAATKAGRNARRRGNRRELQLAKALGGVKVGHHGGPEDVRVGLFNVQSKVRAGAKFPGWMVTELDKLPRTGGRVPILIVTGPPGLDPYDRRKRPAIVVLHLADWRDLHGEETA